MTSTIDGPELCFEPLTNRLGDRIATALEKLAGTPPAPCDFTVADAFVLSGETAGLAPVLRVNRVDVALLRGIDRARDTLLANTERFARGFAANNALLWRARAAWANRRWSRLRMQPSMRGLPTRPVCNP